MKYFLFLFTVLLYTISAQAQAPSYPAAKDFNLAESDAQAITLADEVMYAMGGYEAWRNTHFIRWTFFGNRTLLWDKWSGQVRIDFPESEDIYQVNIHSGKGEIWLAGQQQSHPDTLRKYLERAKSIWINDSYWLVMPYKLKDSGVALQYIEPTTADTGLRHKLQLTFQAVGDTPDNKYWIFVDDKTKLIDEWQFFTHFNDPDPRFSTPWKGYEQHGTILLGGDRGRGQLTDIGVYEEVPSEVFSGGAAYEIVGWE